VDPILSVSPHTTTVYNPGDTVLLTARSPLFPATGGFFSEIAHYKVATGAPPGGWPTYLKADDYVEITGVPNSSLAGYTMEEWTGTTMQFSGTFGAGTDFGPNGTMIVATGQLGSSTPDPTNYYYHSGNTTTHSSTGDLRGYILKNPSGVIVDAATYGAYTFPAASGVSATDWSGSTPAVSSSGNRLNGPDVNSATNWINSGTSPQDPNVLNSGLTTPVAGSMAGFQWSYLGTPFDTNSRIVVGPYTVPGTYQYVASYNTICGTFFDTATVIASSSVPVTLTSFNAVRRGSDVIIDWTTASERNNDHFEVQRSADGERFETIAHVKGKGSNSSRNTYSVTDPNAFNLASSNTLYYRLRQVDFDGTTTTGNKVKVTNLGGRTIRTLLYPNPNNGTFSADISTEGTGPLSVTVYNALGTAVWSGTQAAHAGTAHLEIGLELPVGVYLLQVEQDGSRSTSRFLVRQ
jgi:hypothetical protein